MPKVTLVSPYGRLVPVEEQDVSLFVNKLGYSVESGQRAAQRAGFEAEEAYFSTPGERAKTAAQGALSGLTLGLTDLGADDRSRVRAEYNPGTRLGFEIGGLVVGSLASGGTSLGARALSFTPTGLAAKAGLGLGRAAGGGFKGAMLAGAAEGALQGIGQNISAYGLRGDPFTAESVVAGAGVGAILGGGMEALGFGLRRAGRALKESGEALEDVRKIPSKPLDIVDDASYGQLRQVVSDLKADAKAAIKETEEMVKSLRLPSAKGEAVAGFKQSASKGLVDIGPSIRQVREQANDLFATLGVDPALSKAAASEISTVRRLAGNFDSVIKSGDAVKGAKYYDEYYEAVSRLGEKIGEPIPLKKLSLEVTGGKVYSMLDKGAYTGVADKLTNKVMSATALAPEAQAALAAKTQELRAAAEVLDLLPSLPKNKNAFFSMSAAERTRLADVLERATGLSFSPSAKKLSDTLSELTAKVGVIADGSAAKQFMVAMEAIANAPKTVTVPAGKVKGPKSKKGEILRGGIARQLSSTLGSIAPNWAKPFARQVGWTAGKNLGGFAVGYTASGGDITAGVAAAIALNNSVRSRLKRATGALLSGVGKVTSASAPAMTRVMDSLSLEGEEKPSKDLKEAVKRRSDEIFDLASGRAVDLGFAGLQEIRDFSPELAELSNKKIYEVFGYLAANLPKDPGTVMIGGKSRWELTDQKAREASEVIYGAMMPLEAYEDFILGTLSPYAMRSFRDVWPELHSRAVEDLVENLPKLLKNSTASERSKLSYILGVPVSSLNDPKIAKSFQEDLLNAPNQAMQAKQPVNKPSGSAQSLQTSAQKLIDR